MRQARIRISGTRMTLMRRRNRTNPPRNGGSLKGNDGLKRGAGAADSNIGFGLPQLDGLGRLYAHPGNVAPPARRLDRQRLAGASRLAAEPPALRASYFTPKFSSMNFHIAARMCALRAGSTTPWRDFG